MAAEDTTAHERKSVLYQVKEYDGDDNSTSLRDLDAHEIGSSHLLMSIYQRRRGLFPGEE